MGRNRHTVHMAEAIDLMSSVFTRFLWEFCKFSLYFFLLFDLNPVSYHRAAWSHILIQTLILSPKANLQRQDGISNEIDTENLPQGE
jgi:hypothetical protein